MAQIILSNGSAAATPAAAPEKDKHGHVKKEEKK